MIHKKSLQITLCLVMATVMALTSHIYVSEWSKPLLNSLMRDFHPESYCGYSPLVISAAYATAFIQVGLTVFLYYHTHHLLPVKSNFLKTLVVVCILLESKGDLIRQPFMDILLNYTLGMEGFKPFLFGALHILDKWIANLLLAMCLVYLCPQKYKKLPVDR